MIKRALLGKLEGEEGLNQESGAAPEFSFLGVGQEQEKVLKEQVKRCFSILVTGERGITFEVFSSLSSEICFFLLNNKIHS